MFGASFGASVALAAFTLQGCSRPPTTPQLTTTGFVKYPGYNGDLNVGGTVLVNSGTDEKESVISATFTGVDTRCVGTQTGAGNNCGFHIHSGTTCDAGTGGHYFADSEPNDPWVTSTYTDAANGEAAVADTTVRTGYTLSELEGHVIVVHNAEGGRVACSVLANDETLALESVTGAEQEEPRVSPLAFVGAMLVMAVIGGGAWFCWSSRRGYAAQQDEAVEVQSAAPKQNDSMEGETAA